MKKILVISAVQKEVQPLYEKLNKREIIQKKNISLKKGSFYGRNVDILVTGPGILNSVHSLTLYLENNIKPDIIIQTGCAGGFFEKGVDIGHIGIASKEIYIHLGVENPENRIIPFPLPFSITKDDFVTNKFKTDEGLSLRAKEIISHKTHLNTDIYPFITVSEVTSSKKKSKILYENYGSGMENMEGAGSAYIACLYKIPFIEIRSSSNETGVRDKSKWNFPLSFENSSIAVSEVLKEF